MQVLVRDNSVEQAMMGLKRKMQRESLIAPRKRPEPRPRRPAAFAVQTAVHP